MPVTQIFLLDSKNNRAYWTAILETLNNEGNYHWWAFGRAVISRSGLAYADRIEERENPEVAVVTRTGKQLQDMATMQMEDLMSELAAFVVYSVVPGENGYKLILPMGLQKTPGGYGHFAPLEEDDTEMVVKNGIARPAVKPTVYAVKGVLVRLVTEIKKTHPKMTLLTQFVRGHDYKENDPFGSSPGLQQWEHCFPGTFCIGWKDFANTIDLTHQHAQNIEKLEKRIQRYRSDNPEEYNKLIQKIEKTIRAISTKPTTKEVDFLPLTLLSKPETYLANGGPEYNNGTLTIKDNKGTVLYKGKDNAIWPLKRLQLGDGGFRGGPEYFLGTLICGWTDSDDDDASSQVCVVPNTSAALGSSKVMRVSKFTKRV